MKLIKPSRLHPGDTVAAITLSWGGASQFSQRYEIGIARLKNILDSMSYQKRLYMHSSSNELSSLRDILYPNFTLWCKCGPLPAHGND